MSISNPEFSNSTLLKPVELHDDHNDHKKGLAAMMLAAIGVVFGDIGTSPCTRSKNVLIHTTALRFHQRHYSV